MNVNLRYPTFITLIFFLFIVVFKDESGQFIAGYIMATMVFIISAIFSPASEKEPKKLGIDDTKDIKE